MQSWRGQRIDVKMLMWKNGIGRMEVRSTKLLYLSTNRPKLDPIIEGIGRPNEGSSQPIETYKRSSTKRLLTSTHKLSSHLLVRKQCLCATMPIRQQCSTLIYICRYCVAFYFSAFISKRGDNLTTTPLYFVRDFSASEEIFGKEKSSIWPLVVMHYWIMSLWVVVSDCEPSKKETYLFVCFCANLFCVLTLKF